MKNTFLLFTLVFGLFGAANVNAQTPISFAKGMHSKRTTITLGPNLSKTYSISVRAGQVINVAVSGDINVSKTNEFPVISINLNNGVEDIDQWQDGEGYLSVLAGSTKKFIISLTNSDRKRARTFKLEVKATSNNADYIGGEASDN